MTKHSMRIFRVNPFSSSDKTTLEQQLKGEKWDVEYLSAFGWAVLGAEFGIVSLPPAPPPPPPPQPPTGSRSPDVPPRRRQLGVNQV